MLLTLYVMYYKVITSVAAYIMHANNLIAVVISCSTLSWHFIASTWMIFISKKPGSSILAADLIHFYLLKIISSSPRNLNHSIHKNFKLFTDTDSYFM